MPGRPFMYLCFCVALLLPTPEMATAGDGASDPNVPAVEPGSVTEARTAPVIIESEPLEVTPEETAKRMREKLAQPPSFIETERRLDSGVVEVTTRAGHLCLRPLPDRLQSNLGGSITLAAPCAPF